MYHSFIRLFVNGHLGCFLILAIVNSAIVSIGIQVSFSVTVFSECMCNSGIPGSYDSFFLFFFFKESPCCSP